MKFTNLTMCTICITFCICFSGMATIPVSALASDPAPPDQFPSTQREFWQAMHNTTDEPPAIYEELWSLTEEEQRDRIESMRITPKNPGWPSYEVPIILPPAGSADATIAYTLPHPTEWWVSAIDPVENSTGNYSEIRNIPELGRGDVINVWGIPNHTYEGGFTVTAADITIQQWEGSPVRPVLLASGNTTAAVTVTADNMTLSGLNFSGTTTDGNGAALLATGTDWTPLEELCVEYCVFSGNHADGYGGALCAAYINDLRLTDCVLTKNTAGISGGGIYILKSDGSMMNCICDHNLAESHGGGGSIEESNIRIEDSSFSENTLYYGRGGGLNVYAGSILLTGTTISGNNGASQGGGAYFEYLTANITGCAFCENSRDLICTDGGGTVFYRCNTTLRNTRVNGNVAFNRFCGGCALHWSNATIINTSVNANTGGYEGGTTLLSSTLHAKDSEFCRNVADFNGGGIYCSDSKISLESSAVDWNGAMTGGGVYGLNSGITTYNSSLSNNRDFERGGGANLLASYITMENSTISENTGCFAGGINSESSAVTTLNSNFTNNCGMTAGAINCIEGWVSIFNTTIMDNGNSIVPAIIGNYDIEYSNIIGPEESGVFTSLNANNVTFDTGDGNTTTVSCSGHNFGLGTTNVPSPAPEGNKTIHHALVITAVNFTDQGGLNFDDTKCDLKMQYLDSELGSVNESATTCFLTDGTNWEKIQTTVVCPAENEISVFLTENDLPQSVLDCSNYYLTVFEPDWTTIVPAGPISTETTISITLSSGWNMISFPMKNIISTDIPEEVTAMYTYDTENSTYRNCDPTSPHTCLGYWLGVTYPCSIQITGVPMTCYQQNLSSGWNMIGCRADPTLVGSITTTPETPVSLYRYNTTSGKYQSLTPIQNLNPGEGYWAGVDCCCVLSEE